MNAPAPQLLVAQVDGAVVIRIVGRANFTLSVEFKRLVAELRARGHRRLALELSQCQLMDSTFLGVVAGLGIAGGKEPNGKPCDICLIGAGPRILDLLDNLGVKNLFEIVDTRAPLPEEFKPVQPAGVAAPKLEVSRTCLEAHEVLMALNPDNVAKFKDVAAFLAEDIKRLEGQKP